MIEFLMLPNLYFRLCLFLLLMMGVGLSLTLFFKEVRDQEKPLGIADFFLSPLIGFMVIVFIGYSTLRLLTLFGNARPFWRSLFFLYLCTSFIIAGGIYFFLKKWRQFVWTDSLSILPVLTTFLMGIFPLLPMLIEREATFFAGLGTDAFGYIRVAQSMVDGWYFQPVPELGLADILFHSGRGWSYAVILTQDRPLIYYIVAMVSSMLNINPFQAYLLCGAIPSILFPSYLLFFAFSYPRRKRVNYFLTTLAFFVASLTAFAGNFYHQFLGHVWAIFFLAVLGPSIFLFGFQINHQKKILPVFSFIFCFLSISLYDIRFTIIAFIALFFSFILNFHRFKDGVAIFWIFVSLIPAAAFAGNIPVILRSIFSPMETGGHFRPSFSLQAFLMESGLASGSSLSISIFLSLYCCLLILTFSNLKNRLRSVPENISETSHFLCTYNYLMMYGSLALVSFMLMKSNLWAADKILYLAIPFLIISLFFLIMEESNSRFNTKTAILSVLIVLNVYMSIAKNISVAKDIIENKNSLLIKQDSLSSLSKELNRLKPQLVWFDGNIMAYLAFITFFQDTEWVSLADYETWYHGGGIYPRYIFKDAPDPKIVYKNLLQRNEVRNARNAVVASMKKYMHRRVENYFSNYSIELISREDCEYGSISIALKFTNLTPGKSEPLIVTGEAGAGDFVFVKYLENNEILLGFDHWGTPTIFSSPVRISSNKIYDLEIQMGSLFPPLANIANILYSEMDHKHVVELILVKMDQKEILRSQAKFYSSIPEKVTIGENKIGVPLVEKFFPGKLYRIGELAP